MVLQKHKKNLIKINTPIINLILNKLNSDGKKYINYKILKQTFKLLKLNGYNKPEICLEKAIYKLKLPIMLQSQKKGGSVYKIPVRINFKKSISIAISILLNSIKLKTNINFSQALCNEIMNILNDKGNSILITQNLLKQALSLRVFSKFS